LKKEKGCRGNTDLREGEKTSCLLCWWAGRVKRSRGEKRPAGGGQSSWGRKRERKRKKMQNGYLVHLEKGKEIRKKKTGEVGTMGKIGRPGVSNRGAP